ncbi:hypothetical protein KC669_03165 [Candidatus Dojkabacteria bacterium]|uniref:LamG domain-containing protein n=1 Tax=Candidatus Dojkabacteria bacterium TaxID=2099670 RepID=A0A955RLF2_9BACT|nr:hypothetical protein [Candidatus Dojkabacteria bacterium]
MNTFKLLLVALAAIFIFTFATNLAAQENEAPEDDVTFFVINPSARVESMTSTIWQNNKFSIVLGDTLSDNCYVNSSWSVDQRITLRTPAPECSNRKAKVSFNLFDTSFDVVLEDAAVSDIHGIDYTWVGSLQQRYYAVAIVTTNNVFHTWIAAYDNASEVQIWPTMVELTGVHGVSIHEQYIVLLEGDRTIRYDWVLPDENHLDNSNNVPATCRSFVMGDKWGLCHDYLGNLQGIWLETFAIFMVKPNTSVGTMGVADNMGYINNNGVIEWFDLAFLHEQTVGIAQDKTIQVTETLRVDLINGEQLSFFDGNVLVGNFFWEDMLDFDANSQWLCFGAIGGDVCLKYWYYEGDIYLDEQDNYVNLPIYSEGLTGWIDIQQSSNGIVIIRDSTGVKRDSFIIFDEN